MYSVSVKVLTVMKSYQLYSTLSEILKRGRGEKIIEDSTGLTTV